MINDLVPGNHPVQPEQRYHVLDVLRGFALFGILVINAIVFSGIFFLAPVGAVDFSTLDTSVYKALDVLVLGKFYSIFSLLFGIGFFIFLSRAEMRGSGARGLFSRRLLILLAIGLAHGFVWAGDILTLYAMMGFLLLLFYRSQPRTLLFWIAGILLLRILIYCVMWWSGMDHPLAPSPEDSGGGVPEDGSSAVSAIVDGFHGGYLAVFQTNFSLIYGRWMDLLVSMRPFSVLVMFLIGLWIGRAGILEELQSRSRWLRRWAGWGLGLGLPLNGLWIWWIKDVSPYLPGSPMGLIEVLVSTIAVPLLALGYVAGIALLMQKGRAVGWLMLLAPVGRMGLTNYLMQTVVGIVIFYGIGFGLFGQVGVATAVALMIPVYVAQVLYSTWWLRHFRFGPAEWLWRRLTYGAGQAA